MNRETEPTAETTISRRKFLTLFGLATAAAAANTVAPGLLEKIWSWFGTSARFAGSDYGTGVETDAWVEEYTSVPDDPMEGWHL